MGNSSHLLQKGLVYLSIRFFKTNYVFEIFTLKQECERYLGSQVLAGDDGRRQAEQ